jgi:Uma2 family endonuclease
MTIKPNRIERYYDYHKVEGEELGQSRFHFAALKYLIAVLEWLFAGQKLTVLSEVNFYQTDQPKELPKCPDLAVVDGSPEEVLSVEETPSYYVGEDGPPPRVAFELASKETWKIDLEDKPALYAALGIKEYFAFDPNVKTVWTRSWREQNRLIGWRLDENTGEYVRLPKDETGRMWSEELQSWLVVEGPLLRLYSADGERRLTQGEAGFEQAAIIQARVDEERAIARVEKLRADNEKQKAEIAQAQLETERQRAAAERIRMEKLLERLRQLGEDPDKLV